MDFKTITTYMFQNKRNWNELSNEDKESFFFIFNRYMAKKYPKQSQFFNDKNIDKATSMDVWFEFLKKEVRIPFWFWKGATKRKEPDIKNWIYLKEFHQLDVKDIYILCEMFPKETKEEINRIDLIKKEEEK